MPRSPNPRSTGSLEARRAAYARQQATRPPGGRPTPLPSLHQQPSRLRGWAIVLAWLLTLVALLVAGAAWFLMAAALVTPISLSRAALQIVLLTPALGAALALPAVCCALLATRRAKRLGARLAAPVTLVWLATAILVAGLLFGGLVAAPRYRLGQFALGIQAHCARVAASLQAYGTPPDATTLLANIQAVSQTLLADEAALPGDVQALAALSAPQPKYAPLLQDCQMVAQDDKQFIGDLKASMMQAVAALPPNPAPVVNTLSTYDKQVGAALAEIETLGAALKQEVYAPFQPG